MCITCNTFKRQVCLRFIRGLILGHLVPEYIGIPQTRMQMRGGRIRNSFQCRSKVTHVFDWASACDGLMADI